MWPESPSRISAANDPWIWCFFECFSTISSVLFLDIVYKIMRLFFPVLRKKAHNKFFIRNPPSHQKKTRKFQLPEYSAIPKIRIWILLQNLVIKTIMTKFLSFDQFCHFFDQENYYSQYGQIAIKQIIFRRCQSHIFF